jgi:NADPH:quinone reductase
MRRMIVTRFGGPEVVELRTTEDRPPTRGRVRVRVTHASLGSTDALARRGGHLLQPRPGFTPGYDLVGVIETSTRESEASGLAVGSRVAACLPRMGAHATSIDLPPSRLVPVPDALPSEVAAALPLDLVTAGLAISLAALPPAATLLVQGASGPVGALLVQHARAAGHPVIGTSSARNRATVESLGAAWVDYRDAEATAGILETVPGGVAAAVDHTGSREVRGLVASGGIVVRLSFVGRPGRERHDTASGSIATLSRTLGRPRERLVSVPLLAATRPGRARAMLAAGLDRMARGELRPPVIEVLPFTEPADAHARLDRGAANTKLVLAM